MPDHWKTDVPEGYGHMRVAGLAATGERGVPLLIAQLSDPSAAVRDQACEALGEIGPAAHSAVPRLIELLRDDSVPGESEKPLAAAERSEAKALTPNQEPVWLRAASALERIGPAARAAIGPLEARLRDPDRHAATYVLGALGGIAGPDDRQLVPSVRPFLSHDQIQVHANALSVLIRIVPDDPATAEDVRAFLKRCRLRQQADSLIMADWLMLRYAFAHLPQSPTLAAAVRADLLSFESSPLVDHETRCEAAATLCRLQPPDPVARRHLEEWAAGQSPFWGDNARHALSRLAKEQEKAPTVR